MKRHKWSSEQKLKIVLEGLFLTRQLHKWQVWDGRARASL